MLIIIVAFMVCLGVLIFVHEFGHFAAAKAIGIKVEKFSIGFGPKIPGLGFKKGDTEYVIAALPLGGFVKMAGENPDEELEGKPWEFGSRSPFERMEVVFSGPMMNLILAAVLMSVVFWVGKKMPAYLAQPPIVGWVNEDSPAQEAGVLVGDKIVSLNDQAVNDWEELQTLLATQGGQKLHLAVERKGQLVTLKELTIEENDSLEAANLGIGHFLPSRIGELTVGFPAQKAGLKEGDLVVRINGQAVSDWYEMASIIHDHAEKELRLTILREGEKVVIEIRPTLDQETKKGLIGITPYEEMIVRRYSLWNSIQRGLSKTLLLGKYTFEFLFKLVSGKTSPKSLGGPILIAQVAGATAKSGFSDFLYFMAFLSLQLGILNLFPIPVLDGGHLVFFLIEIITGKPLSIKSREIAQQIGFGILILLMIYVFYNDIMRLFVH